jgi:hypothetical protein
MVTREEQGIRFRACQHCGGDAYLDVLDGPEWRCLQCGRAVPTEAAAKQGRRKAQLPRARRGPGWQAVAG